MSSQLERDLRSALAARVAKLPADASAGLSAGDYRPRGTAGRTALALATITLAAAAAIAISLVGLGTDAPRAFAGWSATPTAAGRDQTQRAVAPCRSQLADLPRRHGTEAGIGPRALSTLPARGWRPVLVDTRGPYTTVLFEVDRGRAVSTCFAGSRGAISLGTAVGARPPARVPPRRVAYASSGSTTTPPDEGSRQFSYVVGRTGAGVRGVTVRLNDGARVTASCANGWFLAWWPGSHGLRATEVKTASS